MRRKISLVLTMCICILCFAGCKQVVEYEYDLPGVVRSVDEDEITIVPVISYTTLWNEDYKYWFGDNTAYFVIGNSYNWDAVYADEDNAVTLKLNDEVRRKNDMDEFVVNAEGKMVNFIIKNGVVTNMRLTKTDVAYRLEEVNGIEGELYHGKSYSVITLDDIYTVIWSAESDCFNIYICNSDDTVEYNLNITGSDLAKCYVLDSNTSEMKLWVDAVCESLLITVSSNITIKAYKGKLDMGSDGMIKNILIDEDESVLEVKYVS